MPDEKNALSGYNQELMQALMNPPPNKPWAWTKNFPTASSFFKEALAYAPLGAGFRGGAPLPNRLAGPQASSPVVQALMNPPRQQVFNNPPATLPGNAFDLRTLRPSALGPAPVLPPRPLEPAMRIGDRTFTGSNHGFAYDKAVAELGAGAVDRAMAAYDPRKVAWGDNPIDGFVTSDGRYLTRNEAAAHLKQQGIGGPKLLD